MSSTQYGTVNGGGVADIAADDINNLRLKYKEGFKREGDREKNILTNSDKKTGSKLGMDERTYSKGTNCSLRIINYFLHHSHHSDLAVWNTSSHATPSLNIVLRPLISFIDDLQDSLQDSFHNSMTYLTHGSFSDNWANFFCFCSDYLRYTYLMLL